MSHSLVTAAAMVAQGYFSSSAVLKSPVGPAGLHRVIHRLSAVLAIELIIGELRCRNTRRRRPGFILRVQSVNLPREDGVGLGLLVETRVVKGVRSIAWRELWVQILNH